MPKIIWKVGGQEKQRRKGVESVQKMITRDKVARKGDKERVEGVLMIRSSVKIL